MKRMMITLLWALLSFCLLMDNVAAQNYTLTVQVYRAGTTDPLGGAQVVLRVPASPGTFTSSRFKNAGPNGQAVFNNVSAAAYTLSASKSSCSQSVSYTMPANNANTTIEVPCPQPRTLSVRVNQAGKPGEWITGASVLLTPTTQSADFLIGQGSGISTNNLGFAVLQDVIPGPYQLRVSRSDCGTNNVQYTMPTADATTTAELACPVESNLTVHVSQEGTGQALAGVTVRLNPPGTFSVGPPSGSSGFSLSPGAPQGTTDSNGNVVLTGVEDGNYTLAAYKNNCQTKNTGYNMPANDANTSVDLNCGSSLIVHVSQQGQPIGGISGAKVEVTTQSSSTPLVQMTGQTGSAVFPNIYSGNYTIKASKSGCSQSSQSFSMTYANASADLTLNCKLNQGNKLTVLVLEAGTLIGKQGEWIAGAKVRLAPPKNPNKYVELTTDKSGSAVFDKVVSGGYLITTTKPGCSSKSTTYTMPASASTVRIDLVCSGGKSTQKK